MSKKRSIILCGAELVQVNEQGVAAGTIKPGYLCKGISSVAHQTVSDGTPVPAAFALERDELGQGIDNARQGLGTGSAFYAVGDTVKIGVFPPGTRLTAFVGSGEDIAEDELLQSAGDGTLKSRTGTNYVVARAREAHTPDNVGAGAIIVEVM